MKKWYFLPGIPPLRTAVPYRYRGKRMDRFPVSRWEQARVEPIYECLPGFSADLRRFKRFAQWPAEARGYVRRIEELLEVPVALVSMGRSREETIVLDKRFSWV